ncbi:MULTISPECIES: hypothetical protein [unclassified Mesorhizobium]|uniref:hypothetical protein n=1 Tax=unclassified Mesorhizobium TaxID=325217 RepID=UPI003336BCD0
MREINPRGTVEGIEVRVPVLPDDARAQVAVAADFGPPILNQTLLRDDEHRVNEVA